MIHLYRGPSHGSSCATSMLFLASAHFQYMAKRMLSSYPHLLYVQSRTTLYRPYTIHVRTSSFSHRTFLVPSFTHFEHSERAAFHTLLRLLLWLLLCCRCNYSSLHNLVRDFLCDFFSRSIQDKYHAFRLISSSHQSN